METVRSKDGTRIAYERSGKGSPLVLVHGTTGNHLSFRLVQPLLAEHFTVYAVDRRGRGESGDTPDYAIKREFEDLAALVDSLGEPAKWIVDNGTGFPMGKDGQAKVTRLGRPPEPDAAKAASLPLCAVCAGYPVGVAVRYPSKEELAHRRVDAVCPDNDVE